MPSQVLTNVENNFTKGLITEFTGLNFPENAATDCDNCKFTLVGDVNRRLGINGETHGSSTAAVRVGAVSTYKWNNAGGDGSTEVVVAQVGDTLRFFKSSSATTTNPLSTQQLISTVLLSNYAVSGTFDQTLECEYTDGNGYLFIFHPSCEPIYCSYNAGTIVGTAITVKIRDFAGVAESGVADNFRPSQLSNEHNYNLINQGWISGNPWSTTSTTNHFVTVGIKVFVVAAGIALVLGQNVVVTSAEVPPRGGPHSYLQGTVTAYAGVNMTIAVTSVFQAPFTATSAAGWTIVPVSTGYITTWATATGTYPSNSDQWWSFKNASGVFDPATTALNTTIGSGPAPKGSIVLDAFQQFRSSTSGVSSITNVTASKRPRTGAWFQGRIWYTGVDSQQAATGDASFYTWTENIYFSQIVNSINDFGHCYQKNDPTSETLFDLLPTDGGVIQIQGCGSIYKLFPMQNALLVFAANGIWFITGSSGIGFTANDYTIYKLSSVRSISGTSFVNVNGYPYFWNEEGIYKVEPTKQDNAPDSRRNALEVTPITVGTILTFFDAIPSSSKRHVRGAYDPIEYVIQWIYRDTEDTGVTDRYQFSNMLNFNTFNNAFYPYSVTSNGINTINSIVYVSSPGGSTTPDPTFKYLVSSDVFFITFGEENDTSYLDWGEGNYISYFITGYKLHGQAQRRFQLPYIYVFSRAEVPTSYKIQGLWDYAISGNSGKWSSEQLVNNWSPNFGMIFRRHRIRGQGIVLQLKVTSSDGQPFDIMGWSAFESQNTGI